MLSVENVTKCFNTTKALDNLSINFERGKIIGLLGENGAGKTTLLRCLMGIYDVDSGNVTLNSEKIFNNPSAKEKIGFYATDMEILPYMPIKEVLNFYKGLYKNFSTEKFMELNKSFGVNLNDKIANLSLGNKTRVGIMLSLSISPEYILLDEPMNGLDLVAKRKFFEIIGEEVDKYETGIIISSHNIKELEVICDEIIIVSEGKLTLQTEIDSVKNRNRKYQVVFKNDSEVDFTKIQGLLDYQKEGSIYYMYFDSDLDESEFLAGGPLSNFETLLVERISVSLEDVFLAYRRGKNE